MKQLSTILIEISVVLCLCLTGCGSHKKQDVDNSNRVYDKYQVEVNSSLNVRKAPKKNSLKVGVLYNGDVVDVVGIYDDWAEIDMNGTRGFVSAKYIKLVWKAPEDQVSQADGQGKGSSSFDGISEKMMSWIGSHLTLLSILAGVIIVLLIISRYVTNQWLAFSLAIPAYMATIAIGTTLAFIAEIILRIMDFINPLSWILSWLADDVDSLFWGVVLTILCDWMSMGVFAVIIGYMLIYCSTSFGFRYPKMIFACILGIAIVIICMFIHADIHASSTFVYGDLSLTLLYIIGGIACAFSLLFINQNFKDCR